MFELYEYDEFDVFIKKRIFATLVLGVIYGVIYPALINQQGIQSLTSVIISSSITYIITIVYLAKTLGDIHKENTHIQSIVNIKKYVYVLNLLFFPLVAILDLIFLIFKFSLRSYLIDDTQVIYVPNIQPIEPIQLVQQDQPIEPIQPHQYTLKHINATKEELEEMKKECPVCMDNKINSKFNCNHKFCSDCSKKCKECPLCRAPTNEIYILNDFDKIKEQTILEINTPPV